MIIVVYIKIGWGRRNYSYLPVCIADQNHFMKKLSIRSVLWHNLPIDQKQLLQRMVILWHNEPDNRLKNIENGKREKERERMQKVVSVEWKWYVWMHTHGSRIVCGAIQCRSSLINLVVNRCRINRLPSFSISVSSHTQHSKIQRIAFRIMFSMSHIPSRHLEIVRQPSKA